MNRAVLACVPVALALLLSPGSSRADDEETVPTFAFTGARLAGHAGGAAAPEAGPSLGAADVARRQDEVRRFLAGKGSGELGPRELGQLYTLAGDFALIHAMVASGEIDPAASRRIGQARARLVDQVLARLAVELAARKTRLGVNDFGSGEVNARTDIDLTLYAESESVKPDWLTARFAALCKEIGGIDPRQMDVTAHRYDATIPDWRQQRSVKEFELRMRAGRELLKRNPEAYALEGAYVQEVMARSVKEGAETFRWLQVDGDKVTEKRMPAADVPAFFYRPDVKPRYAWGAAVANWHFHGVHAGDDAAQAKNLLRSVDEGAGLAARADASFAQLKTTAYADLPDDARRAVAQRLYGHLPGDAPGEMFMALEVARDIRRRKAAGAATTDDLILAPFIAAERGLAAGVPGVNDRLLAERARARYLAASKALLVENIMQSAPPRLADWLAPRPDDVARGVVHFVDEAGKLREMKYDAAVQKRLQYAAFFELLDSVELLPPEHLARLAGENPRFRKDIETLQKIVKKRRETMLLPAESDLPPADAIEMRRRNAQAVLDAYEELGRSENGRELVGRLKGTWAFGKAFEDWAKSRLGDALVHASGRRMGAVLDGLRLKTLEVEQAYAGGKKRRPPTEPDGGEQYTSPAWLTRLSYANSVSTVLTEYVKQGELGWPVIKTALLEGMSYVPVVGMVLDVHRSGATAVAQIVLTQVIPGYGQVMIVLNASVGLVNLGGAIVFEPLKRDKVLLAYQGFLPPQPGGVFTTGTRERVESPRRGLLDVVAPDRAMPLDERRERLYLNFAPDVNLKVGRRLGLARPETSWEAGLWKNTEPEVVITVLTGFVNSWWDGWGPFATDDELTVKRMMDEHYGEEIRAKLVGLLVQDYWAGRILYAEKQIYKPFMDDLARTAGVDLAVAEAMARARERFAADGDAGALAESGRVAQGAVLEAMPRIDPGIAILAAPRVEVREDAQRIDSYGLRATIAASPSDEHPGPFQVAWELRPMDQEARRLASEGGRTEMESAADRVQVTAVLLDARGRELARAQVVLPVRKERVAEEEKAAAVQQGAPAPAEEGPGAAPGDCSKQREAVLRRCKEMADRQVERNCKPVYSGCALDVAGCLVAYVSNALPDSHCALPGYLGCANGPVEGFLGCLQRCNDDFSAARINSYGLLPCRLACQEEIDAGIKACKEGRTPAPPRTTPAAPPAAEAPATWTRVVPRPESSVEITPRSTLRMVASARGGGSDFAPGPNNAAPRMLRPVSGDWTLETRLHFAPQYPFQGAGVVVCFDADPRSSSCVRVVERQVWGPGQIVNMQGTMKEYAGTTTYLQVRKLGTSYTAWYSADGRGWIELGTRQHGGEPRYAGVMTLRQAYGGHEDVDSVAEFDYVRIVPAGP